MEKEEDYKIKHHYIADLKHYVYIVEDGKECPICGFPKNIMSTCEYMHGGNSHLVESHSVEISEEEYQKWKKK